MNIFSQIFNGMRNLFQWWIVLAPWEAGIRVRKGKHVKILDAGIHFRIPFLDRFFIQSTRFRIVDLPIQTLTTADGKTITLKGQVGFRILDIGRLYETLHAAEGTIVAVVASELSNYIVTNDEHACKPYRIQDTVNENIIEQLNDFGLSECNLTITDYCKVKTYRLITQDIWTPGTPYLNTDEESFDKMMGM